MSIFKYLACFYQVLYRRCMLGMFTGFDYHVKLVGAAKVKNENNKKE